MLKIDDITFRNEFVALVFLTLLSEESKNTLMENLNSTINKPVFKRNEIRKIFVKRKPQQVIIFLKYKNGVYEIQGYQFGKTDNLTGKKSHLRTFQQIFKDKTPEEIDLYY